MKRKFYEELIKWEKENIKEPLLVIGARQVGKTWIIKSFCEKMYEKYIYINLEEQKDLITIFEDNLTPEVILKKLSMVFGKTIDSKTTIVIDEIQQCERAITALKYFCEAKENYRIICAGSLLGVKVKRFESSFPVGKVYIKNMFPMDFEEFLLALGEDTLRDGIKEAFTEMSPLSEAIHKKALSLYHDYLIVGGMPQIVKNYIDHEKNITLFNREMQEYIRLAYMADMTKYVTNVTETAKISAVYESIPRQLAKENPKFKYKEIRDTAIKRDYFGPIDWLSSSGMIYKINKLELPQSPIKAYEDVDSFKIYLSDTGLLSNMCGITPQELLPDRHNMFKGAVIENYCIEQLMIKHKDLYYFKPSESMEIDLITTIDGNIIPIEIKSGRHKRSTSLNNYVEKYQPQYSIRISENNFGMTNGIKSVPLYAVFCI
ncbi:MAG: ATP-binding protein [Lachnospiraceae bacterium]|nr:ATP-binding protein [Lachnospiraceae bacterium]